MPKTITKPTPAAPAIPDYSSILDLARAIGRSWDQHSAADRDAVALSHDKTNGGCLQHFQAEARMLETEAYIDRLGYQIAAMTPKAPEEVAAMLLLAYGSLPMVIENNDDDNRQLHKASALIERCLLAMIGTGIDLKPYGLEHYAVALSRGEVAR